jgi:hypothetical protein
MKIDDHHHYGRRTNVNGESGIPAIAEIKQRIEIVGHLDDKRFAHLRGQPKSGVLGYSEDHATAGGKAHLAGADQAVRQNLRAIASAQTAAAEFHLATPAPPALAAAGIERDVMQGEQVGQAAIQHFRWNLDPLGLAGGSTDFDDQFG